MISMGAAATQMEMLCDKLEKSEDITEEMRSLFADFQKDISKSVDWHIQCIEYLKSQVEHSGKIMGLWRARNAHATKILEDYKASTLGIVKSSTVPMKGNLGKFIAVKNSKETLIVDENDEDIKGFYTVEKVTSVLDKEAIRKDLANGITMKGARLEQGEHLRW